MASDEKLIQEFREAEREYKRALNAYYQNYCESYKDSLNQQKVCIVRRGKFINIVVESVTFDSQKGWVTVGKDESGKLRQVHVSELFTFESGLLGKPQYPDYYGPVCLEQVYSH